MLRNVVVAALAGTLVAVFVGVALRGTPHRAVAPSRAAIGAALDRLPVAFERNVGQAGRGTSFVAHRGGYELLIKPTGLTMLLSRAPLLARRALPKHNTALAPVSLSLETLGSSPSARVTGTSRLPGVVNYLRGSKADWITGVPTFSGVRLQRIYPGIDLTYSGAQNRVEYDFTVGAGADPQAIRLGVSGAQALQLDAGGNLVARTAAGSVVEHAPLAYQTIAGKRKPVPVAFTLHGRTVGFSVASYDRSVPLLIDPVITYSTYLAGTDGESTAYGVAVDPTSGDIVVTGPTNSYSFVGGPAYKPVSQDAYVISLDATGSTVNYTDYVGGFGDDEATAVALDSSGNAYITGFTDSPSFPLTRPLGFNDDDQTYGHDFDAFLTELNATDGTLMFSTLLGGTQDDEGEAIAIGPGDSVYVTGLTNSTNDFRTTTGAFQEAPLSRPYYAAFVEKFEPDGYGGETLDYSTLLSGKQASAVYGAVTGLTEGTGIAVDGSGDAWVTGLTMTTNFPTTPGGYSTSMGNALSSGFVSELDPTGSTLYYSSFLGSTATGSKSQGTGIALSGANVVVVGSTNGVGFPVSSGALQSSHSGYHADAFVTELAPGQHGAAQLAYSTYLGGSNSDLGEGVAVDQSNGDLYVTGETDSSDFPVTAGAFQRTLDGSGNAFVARLDPSQSGAASLVWSSFLGGGGDAGYGIAVPSTGHELVVGRTVSLDFPTVNALQGANGNVLSSGFLTEIADGPSVPVNTSLPTITGTAAFGQVLTGALGTWTPVGPLTRSKQWLRCDSTGANCTPIAGADNLTYGVKSGDVGSTLRFQVTEANAVTVVAVSDPTPVIGALVNTAPPQISGNVGVGQFLTGSLGTWTTTSGAGAASTARQWLRCDSGAQNCYPIPGATFANYGVKSADIGSTLVFQVTKSNTAASVSAASAATNVVGAPLNLSLPTVSGTAAFGQTLTGSLGTWSTFAVRPLATARQWLRCDATGDNCAAVTTTLTYGLKSADIGHTMRFQVTENNVAGVVTAMSAATLIVGAPVNTSPPTISGTAQNGVLLTGAIGTWTTSAGAGVTTVARQWLRCNGSSCTPIAGATFTNYRVTTADLGYSLEFQVTETNNAGPITAVSAPTGVVSS